jgi:hypothetical protein
MTLELDRALHRKLKLPSFELGVPAASVLRVLLELHDSDPKVAKAVDRASSYSSKAGSRRTV